MSQESKRLALGVLFIIIAAFVAYKTLPVNAVTVVELQARIAALQQQLNVLQGNPVSSAVTKNLSLGSSGSDVISLQQLLVSQGFLAMPPGVAMGYYGNLTKSAVSRWQAEHGVSTTGVWGPLSRELSQRQVKTDIAKNETATVTQTQTVAVSDNYPSTPGTPAASISSSQISLSWTPSADKAGIKGYNIYRNGVRQNVSASNSYTDTDLSPSTSYTYYVTAFDADGRVSAPSGSVTVTASGAISANPAPASGERVSPTPTPSPAPAPAPAASPSTQTVTPSQGQGSECSNWQTDWILCDGFESGDWSAWSGYTASGLGHINVVNTKAFSGNYSANIYYSNPNSIDINLYFYKFLNNDHIFLRGYVYFAQPDPGATIYGQRKLLYWKQTQAASDEFVCVLSSFDWTYGKTGYVPGKIKLSNGCETLKATATHPASFNNIPYDATGPGLNLDFNRWYEIQEEIKLNTPGQSDGYMNVWVDGVKDLGLSPQNINIRDTFAENFGIIEIGRQMDPWISTGGFNMVQAPQSSEQRYWDNIIISKSFITP